MATSCSPVAALVARVESDGLRPAGRARLAAWAASQSLLGSYASPGELAAACRSAPPADQDALVEALLRVGEADTLAQLSVLAGVSGHLGRRVATWRAAGVAPCDLAMMEADMLAEAWAATASLVPVTGRRGVPPPKVALHIADAAHDSVRGPRRRERRLSARWAPLEAA